MVSTVRYSAEIIEWGNKEKKEWNENKKDYHYVWWAKYDMNL